MVVPFPVSLNLEGRRCIVIGNDAEADQKANALHESGAIVERIHDPAALDDSQLRDAFFVISTPQDPALSARLRALADSRHFLLCCIDQPAFGVVSMAAIAKGGPVRVAISTAGLAPRVGKLMKNALQKALNGIAPPPTTRCGRPGCRSWWAAGA
jgi:precorrin-2 dehydrogenase / sirohydrochlorin ferrochelatase